ncbi:MAG TPA: DUF2283 domain-containing protein [Ktedonobacterales bacterium]|nr:DUF2283 domain-containing protein [Ktedonobacterales bacterium]
MYNLKLSRRMIAPFLAIAYLPLLLDGLVFYDFFINNATSRLDVESLALCIIGALLLFAGALTVTWSRPLLFALYMGGIMLVLGSAMGSVLLGHFGLPLLAFGLLAVSFVIAVRHLRKALAQVQVQVQEAASSSFDINPYLALIPALKKSPQHSLWSHYDPETDTLAIHFTELGTPNVASDSDMTDDDVIVRYNDAGEVIGLTILHASLRKAP